MPWARFKRLHLESYARREAPKVARRGERRQAQRGGRPADRLANPDAVLTRSDLRELGWERRAVDAIVRACPAVAIPGYSRTVVLGRDYLELVERSTCRGDRVRPT